MTSKSKKRRRRLIKYGAIGLGALAAAYGLNKYFGGGGETPASGGSGETVDTAAGDEGALESPTMAGFGMNKTLLFAGAAILVLYLVMKKR